MTKHIQYTAKGLASLGRGPDSTLVHMSPRELQGLHALARAHGKELTTNPHTGLPEAGILDTILPIAATVLTGDPMIGAAVSGATTMMKGGSLQQGLMAGLMSYGMGQLVPGLTGMQDAAPITEGELTPELFPTYTPSPEVAQATASQATASQTGAGAAQAGTASVQGEAPPNISNTLNTSSAPTDTSGGAINFNAPSFTNPGGLGTQANPQALATFGSPTTPSAPAPAAPAPAAPAPAAAAPAAAPAATPAKSWWGGLTGTQQLGVGAAGLMGLKALGQQQTLNTAPLQTPNYYVGSTYSPGTPNPNYGKPGNTQPALIGQGYKQGSFSPTYVPPVYVPPITAKEGGIIGLARGGAIKKMDMGGITGDRTNRPHYMTNEADVVPDMFNATSPNAVIQSDAPGVIPISKATGAGPNRLATPTTANDTLVKNMMKNGAATSPRYLSMIAGDPTIDPAYSGMAQQYLATQKLGAGSNYGLTMPAGASSATATAAQGGVMQSNMAKGGMAALPEYAAGGRLLHGDGDGMSDSIPAVIRGKNTQRAALADGEFVIPADVVSHLGNGSTNAGAKKLYHMMDKIRHARTGNAKQGKQINPERFMPA